MNDTNTDQAVAKHLDDLEWITHPRDGEEGDTIITSNGFEYPIIEKIYDPEVVFATEHSNFSAFEIERNPNMVIV